MQCLDWACQMSSKGSVWKQRLRVVADMLVKLLFGQAGHLLYTNNFHFLTINIYFFYLFYLNFSVFRSGWPVGKIATSAAPLNFLAGKITSRAKAICVPHSFDPSFQLILELFRCASISWFQVVSQWVTFFTASASTGLSELFLIASKLKPLGSGWHHANTRAVDQSAHLRNRQIAAGAKK